MSLALLTSLGCGFADALAHQRLTPLTPSVGRTCPGDATAVCPSLG